MRVALGGDPSTLNPVISTTNYDFYVEEAVFDGLLKVDSSGALIPDLATQVPSRQNGGLSPDLKTIIYHLRRDVRWQDGKPFTAADVAFTYHLYIDDRVASPFHSLYAQIASLDTPSPYEVVVHLRKPSHALLGEVFAGPGIVPAHILAHVPDVRRSNFNTQPVGTGPYAVRAWKHGDRIELSANDRYFAGAPRIRNLDILFVPDKATRATLLRTGAVDVATIAFNSVRILNGARNLRLFSGPTKTLYYVDLNLHRGPAQSRDARQALAYATDRSPLARALLVQPEDRLLPVRARGCGMNLNKARALLAGRHVHLQLTYAATSFWETMALQLQESWRRAGVDVTLRRLPFGAVFGDGGAVVTGRYDAAIDGLSFGDPSEAADIVGSAARPPNGFNYTGYANASLDRQLAAADASSQGSVRDRLYGAAQTALCRDVPLIPLGWDTYRLGVSKQLQGVAPEPIVSDLWNVADWSFR